MSDVYREWLRHPTTKALFAHMQDRADRIATEMLSSETYKTALNAELAGLQVIARANQLEALKPYLDTDHLEQEIGNVD